MSKEYLEALRTIKIKCYPNSNPSPLVDEALDIIEQALIKAQEQEKENARKDNLIKYYESLIREHQQILKIIKEKKVSIFQLSCCKNVNEYNDLKFKDNEKLTQEEFDLLKRWLGNA